MPADGHVDLKIRIPAGLAEKLEMVAAYNHFGSINDVVRAILQEGWSKFLAQMNTEEELMAKSRAVLEKASPPKNP